MEPAARRYRYSLHFADGSITSGIVYAYDAADALTQATANVAGKVVSRLVTPFPLERRNGRPSVFSSLYAGGSE